MKKILILLITVFYLSSCTSYAPIRLAKAVDIKKFMGDWYVIAYTPTFIDNNAFNAIESYKLTDDKTIATTYTFNAGSFGGEKKVYNPIGFIVENSENAVWRMQFIWPFKSDYRIIYLDKDYQNTIIGRIKRDYFWIMSRSKTIEKKELKKLYKVLEDEGYKLDNYRLMPHTSTL